MNKISSLNYYLRKSPLTRTLSWIMLALVFVFFSIIFGIKINKKPIIYQIKPPVGLPGDLIVINGKDFGNVRDTSYVEFGGIKLTTSSYILWTDNEIKVILPPNIQDGLVYVGVKGIRSKPVFFANSTTVPVEITSSVQTTIPIVTSISAEKMMIGSLLKIYGSNFGNNRGNSKVYFSSNRELLQADEYSNGETFEYIAADANDFDYEYWSDKEIRVYIPDGASSGSMFVESEKGRSIQRNITIDDKVGTKSFILPKNYLIRITTDIEDNSNDKESTIVLRIPRPFKTSSQPLAKLIGVEPEPVIPDYQHTVIHQIQGGRGNGKKKFTQDFAITVYEIRTSVVAQRLNSLNSINKNLKNIALFDSFVPSSNEEIKNLLNIILEKERKETNRAEREKNPYNIAAIIYNYMLKNYSIIQKVRAGKISPLDMLDSKKGDAYDFAVIYAALVRAAGIPCYVDSGLLVGTDLSVKNHWWCEIYLPGFGWMPVDVALGAGLSYSSWQKDINVQKYYFGNLDAQHILFSRGWNEIKSSSSNAKTVQKNRTYALQSIWEEASGKTIKYSSFWAEPNVMGVY